MSIKIHHGAPGSYKTSGAVMDDLPPAVRSGRTVITNVRGLSNEALIRHVLKGSPDFRLIHVDDSGQEGLARLRRWFHWAPKGALLIIDEAQRVWPPAWGSRDLEKLNYPGGVEAAEADGRPEDHWVAFDKHRHHNWDLVLTTPNIKKIRAEIRDVAEGGYFHRNRALFGFGRSYNEAFHTADNLGTAQGDLISVQTKRVKSWVWKLYQSTATGEHHDTQAGTPFWKQPKVVALSLVLVGLVAFVASRPAPAPLRAAAGADGAGEVAARDEKPYREVFPAAAARPAAAASPAPAGVPGGAGRSQPDPLGGWDLQVVGEMRREAEGSWLVWFDANRGGDYARLGRAEVEQLGYEIDRRAPCLYRLRWSGGERFAGCDQPRPPRPAQLVPFGGASS